MDGAGLSEDMIFLAELLVIDGFLWVLIALGDGLLLSVLYPVVSSSCSKTLSFFGPLVKNQYVTIPHKNHKLGKGPWRKSKER